MPRLLKLLPLNTTTLGTKLPAHEPLENKLRPNNSITPQLVLIALLLKPLNRIQTFELHVGIKLVPVAKDVVIRLWHPWSWWHGTYVKI